MEPTGGDSGSDSPLRSSPGGSLLPLFCVFLISAPLQHGNARGSLHIVGFRSNRAEPRENGWHPTLEAETESGGAIQLPDRATWYHLQPVNLLVAHFSSFCSTKISEPCSLTLPSFESRSSWKVQNTNRRYFLLDRVITKREGLFRKSPKPLRTLVITANLMQICWNN